MVSTIGTSGFVLKTQCNTDKSVLENKIDGAGKNHILVALLKKQTIMLKSLKLKLNYLVQMG